ncbi:hypothetical protein SASPL_103583 [Salvia splendens]|uniref:procollagen-proline 4-dioxygenase n=1 Tax=Salvia splendens TaxID=180675 RepID=A0A8X9A909_SALSN|nr:hypothetical protein SASPL_103583 [Salvia splendens]
MGKWRGNRHLGMRYSTIVLALSMLLMATVLLLMVLELGIPVPAGPEEESSPIRLKRMILDSNGGEGLGERGEQRTEVVSWEPRAFIYHNFLSKEECEYLINRATPHMVKSTVVDSETGKSVDSSVRTSYGTFFKRGQDKVIRAIEKRIADYTLIPVEHGEGLHVLHYKVGQKYNPHFDYFVDEFNTRNGGQRIATLLMYLSDVEEGGETVFPAAKGNISSVAGWNGMSECAKKGVSVKPKMGDALLFWSMHPDATLDPSSLHGSCPVIKGDKWSFPVGSEEDLKHIYAVEEVKDWEEDEYRSPRISARTSYGMFLKRGQDKVIRGIEKRIADYTLIPVENGESLYVLHYEKGQKYDPHYDYSDGGSTTRNGGPRMATFLMYLSDVEEGGETVFPSAKGNIEKKGISIKPKMGDALLFWSMNHDGTLDPLSLHG